MTRPGRPARVPGATSRKRTITMTDAEWALIRAAARWRRQSAADYVRLTACGAAAEDVGEAPAGHQKDAGNA